MKTQPIQWMSPEETERFVREIKEMKADAKARPEQAVVTTSPAPRQTSSPGKDFNPSMLILGGF